MIATFWRAAERRLHVLEPIDLVAEGTVDPYSAFEAPLVEVAEAHGGASGDGKIGSLMEIGVVSFRWWKQWEPKGLGYMILEHKQLAIGFMTINLSLKKNIMRGEVYIYIYIHTDEVYH